MEHLLVPTNRILDILSGRIAKMDGLLTLSGGALMLATLRPTYPPVSGLPTRPC